MKKLSLVALLSVLTIGALVGCGNTSSSETPAPSSSETPVSSEAPSSSEVEDTNELPVAWEEGETYQALECSVSLVPGSLSDKNDATITNANAKAVKDFMNDANVRCFDLRDVSEGYGLGHIQGFETVSYFKTIVGKDNQLFSQNEDGTYTARYKESKDVINDIFPKDATLFVMCQVGGRVQPFLKLLDQLDYDMSKVYNIGGWNQIKDLADFGGYEVSLGIAAKEITYDFSTLKPVNA